MLFSLAAVGRGPAAVALVLGTMSVSRLTAGREGATHAQGFCGISQTRFSGSFVRGFLQMSPADISRHGDRISSIFIGKFMLNRNTGAER